MSTSASLDWCRRCLRDPNGWPNWGGLAAGVPRRRRQLQPGGMDEKAVDRAAERRPIRARRRGLAVPLHAVTKGPTMSIPGSIPLTDSRPTIAADLGRYALWVVLRCIRLPLLLFLLVLEPVVTLVLGALALLGVLTALFWKLFGPPNFPFLLMLGISLGLELALIVYRKLIRLLA